MTPTLTPSRPPETLGPPKKPAFLLNAQAKGWRGSVHQSISRYVSNEQLFLSDSFEQANRTVLKLIQENHDVIFTAGGDGTIVYLLNAIETMIRGGVITREDAPTVGILKLGTGNALAHYLETKEILEDLRDLKEGAGLKLHYVNMIEGTGDSIYPFAGIGWDADILHDYDGVKNLVKGTALEPYVAGLGGYGAAIAAKTIPKALIQSTTKIRITNVGDAAFRIDNQGRTLEEYATEQVVYEGPARVCGVSSVPYWGFKIQMFPYADRFAEFFQVRCYFGDVPELLLNLRKFWKGQVKEEKSFSLLAKEVYIEILGDPLPYQVAGDISGIESEILWKLAPEPIKLVTVNAP